MKLIKVSRLSLKMFLAFFLSCTLLALCFSFVTGRLITPYTVSIRERILTLGYLAVGISSYQSGGQELTKNWLMDLKKNENLKAYFLVKGKGIIGSPPFPKDVVNAYNLLEKNKLPKLASKIGVYLVSAQRPSHQTDERYRFVVDSNSLAEGNVGFFLVVSKFSVVLFISSLCCLFVTFLLIKPILTIKRAVHDLTKGKLETRIGPLFKKRRDELSELAFDFDNMAEKLQALISSKERLLEDISHELRSPLSRQQVALELLEECSKDLSLNHYRRAQVENLKLNDLIDEILSLAKLNSSKRVLNLNEINLKSLLKKVVDDANFETQKDCVSLIAPEELTVVADELLINRAIENIVRNAVRYTGDDKKIVIQAKNENDVVTILISDNGPGVKEEDLGKIFDVFYRGSSSSENIMSGYGLGLAIAKQAIGLHGGTITAKNLNERGLEVKINFKPQKKA